MTRRTNAAVAVAAAVDDDGVVVVDADGDGGVHSSRQPSDDDELGVSRVDDLKSLSARLLLPRQPRRRLHYHDGADDDHWSIHR